MLKFYFLHKKVTLLFVPYTNDLPENIQHTVKRYADDRKIIGIIKSPEDAEKTSKWYQQKSGMVKPIAYES